MSNHKGTKVVKQCILNTIYERRIRFFQENEMKTLPKIVPDNFNFSRQNKIVTFYLVIVPSVIPLQKEV